MKCYYSPTDDAVGICKACGKGLSPNYLVEFKFGLACKDRCEEQVTKLSEMISGSLEMQKPTHDILKKSGKSMIGLGLFLLLLGGVFLWQGLGSEGYVDIFSVASGSIFAIFGFTQVFRGYFLARTMNKR